ncbi:MAG TPA: efflux RND transporter periplasmic adaptor subunit [Treponemataceae bacterium]|nr:efflux RND transporter periplasmic adaptor subunit [Treponemataceae bacterium]HOQ93482.1 efflux RND transporter periplasmic adaptor subunit [Treponemataceae bacterium]HPM06577.1 efflux RND transporter periplasmic adaptor subunit [Treponemataceae bacterium]
MNKKKRIKKIKLSSTIVLSFSLLVFIACSKESASDEKIIEEKAVFAVSAFTVEETRIENYLEFGGDIIAKTSLDINPEVQGKIVELKIAVGDYVEKDAVIALVDASRAGMSFALGQIKAPISGTITQVNVVVGSMVAPQLAVAKVSKLDTLLVSMNVPERYVSKIKQEQKAELRFDAYPERFYSASVSEISPVLDATSRTMNVKLSLDRTGQNDGAVKIGMFARVKLVTEVHENAVIIPDAAIVNRFGESFVFVIDENMSVEKRNIVRGIRVDEKSEILSGLEAGEKLVVRGQTLLEEGASVHIVSEISF